METIVHYLIIHLLTVGFSHGFQVTEKLLQEIAKLNDEIIYLQSTSGTSQSAQFTSGTPQSALSTSRSSQSAQSTPRTLQSAQSTSGTSQSPDESFSTSGTSTVTNPYMPATDENGIPLCLQNSSFNNFCTADDSFPTSFADMIQPAVKSSLTSLPSVTNIYECGEGPKFQCNFTTKTLYPSTVQVNLIANSRRSSETTFAFALQTETFTQGVLSRICLPELLSCPIGSPATSSKCRNAGPSPLYLQLRQAQTPNNVLIINSEGLTEVAEMVTAETLISCWCMCDDSASPNGRG